MPQAGMMWIPAVVLTHISLMINDEAVGFLKNILVGICLSLFLFEEKSP